jgi:hypothetical protein
MPFRGVNYIFLGLALILILPVGCLRLEADTSS